MAGTSWPELCIAQALHLQHHSAVMISDHAWHRIGLVFLDHPGLTISQTFVDSQDVSNNGPRRAV